MAIVKWLRGKSENLPEKTVDGQAYFCFDDASVHFDYVDENGNVQRAQVNANDSNTLTGASLSTTINDSDVEIPTSKAVYDNLAEKSTVTIATWTAADFT
jgi:hypothetical protein